MLLIKVLLIKKECSSIPCETTNPVILNKNNLLKKLLVENCNHSIKHNGERHTLSKLRKGYWTPRGKGFIKQIFYHCIVCRRLHSRPHNYTKSPNLSLLRVDDFYLFTCTGISYIAAGHCRTIYNDDVLNESME